MFLTFLADHIKKWWIWGYWSSPLMYAQNAIAVNEFLGHSWQKVMISFFDLLFVHQTTIFTDHLGISFKLNSLFGTG